MKKIITLFSLIMLASCWFTAAAQTEKKSAVHVSFFPPLSTHGPNASEYTNNFSFNLLAGNSRNEKGLAFAGLWNNILNDATGVQFAGLANIIRGDVRGLSFAGIGNTAKTVHGVQFGGLFNHVKGDVLGIQFGGVYNKSQIIRGLQFSGIINYNTYYMQGLQFAGIYNHTNFNKGLQFGGLANYAIDVEGVQFAGIANIAESTNGMQFAGLANRSGDVTGFQFAGLVNVAKHVDGAQFGIINISHHNDYPLGFINIVKEGDMAVGVTYSDIGNIVASLRSGGRVLYGIIGAGYNTDAKDGKFVIEAGFGANIRIWRNFTIKNELKSAYIGDFDNNTYNQSYHFMPAYRISNFEIFAGPGINFLQTEKGKNANIFRKHNLWKKYKTDNMKQLYVGFTVGTQFYIKSAR